MEEAIIIALKKFVASENVQLRHEINLLSTKIDKLDKKIINLDTRLSHKIDKVDSKVDDLTVFVIDIFETNNDDVDKRLKAHNKRITKLEALAA